MKRILYLSCLLFCATAFMSVCSAEVITPASTTIIEKAKANLVDAVAVTNGAIVNHEYLVIHNSYDGTVVLEIRLAKIHWCVDETFYQTGYKVKLSDAVEEIIAPPDNC